MAEAVFQNLGLEMHQITALEGYARVLLETNEQINLTGAKTFEDFALKHVVDVVEAVRAYEEEHEWTREIWDIGSGGGLPGIPLAILRPDLKITLVERRERKAEALSSLVKHCRLTDRVRVVCNSLEQIKERNPGAEHWFRGFLPADKLITYFSEQVPSVLMPRVVLMKGPSWSEELDRALALKKIKPAWIERFQNSYTVEYALPSGAGTRCLVFL